MDLPTFFLIFIKWCILFENKYKKNEVRCTLMSFAHYQSHAIPLFKYFNIVPIELLYFELSSVLMHDIHNSLAPPNLSNWFTEANNIHPYNTLSSAAGNCYIKHSKLNQMKTSFSRVGARVWNSVPQSLRVLPKFMFKKKIQSHFIPNSRNSRLIFASQFYLWAV